MLSILNEHHHTSQKINYLMFHFKNDLIGSTISELVWEEERIVVESLLGSWGADHENSQESGSKGIHTNILYFLCFLFYFSLINMKMCYIYRKSH